MRIVFAYGNISLSSDPDYFAELKNHLLALKQRFAVVFPEETRKGIHINLIFDHSSADFYYNLFPFLEANEIKATVGISPRYISQDTACDTPLAKRLSMPDGLVFQDDIFPIVHPFCSRKELLSLLRSPFIKPACHGNALKNCVTSPQCHESEIILSKESLEQALNQTIDSFIFPFGRYNRESYLKAQSHYRFIFVNGNTINPSNKPGRIFRIPLNDLPSLRKLFSFKEIQRYPLRFLKKRLQERFFNFSKR